MTTWEYFVDERNIVTVNDAQVTAEFLNWEADQGWELVQVLGLADLGGGNQVHFIFRRPKE